MQNLCGRETAGEVLLEVPKHRGQTNRPQESTRTRYKRFWRFVSGPGDAASESCLGGFMPQPNYAPDLNLWMPECPQGGYKVEVNFLATGGDQVDSGLLACDATLRGDDLAGACLFEAVRKAREVGLHLRH